MRRLRCGIDPDDVLVVGHVPSVVARIEATPCSVHTILVHELTDRGHIWYQDSTVKHSLSQSARKIRIWLEQHISS
jgi:hypothetical protein